MDRIRSLACVTRHAFGDGRPKMVLTIQGSLGDHLLCTSVFRELRIRGLQGLWMGSRFEVLFENNNDVDAVIPEAYAHSRWVKWLGGKPICLDYSRYIQETDVDSAPGEHVLVAMNRAAGVKGNVALRPYLTFNTTEKKRINDLRANYICLQTSGIGAQSFMRNKDWYPERMQRVVDALASNFEFIQIGSTIDPPISGAKDMRGRTNVRETAILLAAARLFVGQVGFLMHLARSVDCRSVIIYGGREIPELTGYAVNENLCSAVPCSPCWQRNRCDFDRECMHQISAESVVAAIQRANIGNAQQTLEETTALVA